MGLSAHERRTVELWWAAIDEAARREFLALWNQPDSLATSEGHGRRGELEGRGPRTIVFELHGVWVGEQEDGPTESELWWRYFFEHEVDHPGTFDWMPKSRVFHLGCRAHPVARAAVKRAWIPADFRCPLAHGDCPWRAALDEQPGKSIRLSVRIRPVRRTEAALRVLA